MQWTEPARKLLAVRERHCAGPATDWPFVRRQEAPLRLTPAQIGMCALLGERLPMGMPHDWSLADRIRHGHDYLVELAKVGLGYDLEKWHEHLRATNAGGYRWSNKHLGFPKRIAEAGGGPGLANGRRSADAREEAGSADPACRRSVIQRRRPGMVIRESDRELGICGTPAELNAIADQIERLGPGEELRARADIDADPRPYNRCLAGLTVRATDGPVRVSVTGNHVVATASPAAARVFASFFRFEENASPGTHGHHEWFEGNESIAPDSRPLVISVG